MQRIFVMYSVFAILSWCSTAAVAANTAAPIILEPSMLLKSETPYAGHGVAGDEVLLFNIEMQPHDIPAPESSIGVYRRDSGARVGALQPRDASGWAIPMSIKTVSYTGSGMMTSGTVMVLEVGLVSPTQPPVFSRLIKYSYSYSQKDGFSHQILGVGYLPLLTSSPGELPNGLVLPIGLDFVTTDDGVQHVVIADAIVGSLWSAAMDDLNHWHLQLVAQELGSTPLTRLCEYQGVSIVGFCGYARGPNWTVEPYVQAMWQPIPGVDLSPGAFGLAYVGLTGKMVVNNVGTGALYQIDASRLLDRALPPLTSFKPLETLLSPIPGISDFQGSLVWDRWHPNSPWLYWQRIISTEEEKYFPIYRINVRSGEVQFIAESVMLFDHPSMINVLPSRGAPFTTLVTSNTQERNMAFTNRLLTASHLVGPSVVTETKILLPVAER